MSFPNIAKGRPINPNAVRDANKFVSVTEDTKEKLRELSMLRGVGITKVVDDLVKHAHKSLSTDELHALMVLKRSRSSQT